MFICNGKSKIINFNILNIIIHKWVRTSEVEDTLVDLEEASAAVASEEAMGVDSSQEAVDSVGETEVEEAASAEAEGEEATEEVAVDQEASEEAEVAEVESEPEEEQESLLSLTTDSRESSSTEEKTMHCAQRI